MPDIFDLLGYLCAFVYLTGLCLLALVALAGLCWVFEKLDKLMRTQREP